MNIISLVYPIIYRTTQWEDPRTQGIIREEPLPAGWEMRKTDAGVPYFVDHNTRTTQFQDPRPGAKLVPAPGSKGAYGVPVQYERSFRWKLSQFRYYYKCSELSLAFGALTRVTTWQHSIRSSGYTTMET